MTGTIVHVSVCWAAETSGGRQQIIVDLTQMRRHPGPERIEELLDDLAMICEDVQAAQDSESTSVHSGGRPWRIRLRTERDLATPGRA
jgi:hypothetical protein